MADRNYQVRAVVSSRHAKPVEEVLQKIRAMLEQDYEVIEIYVAGHL